MHGKSEKLVRLQKENEIAAGAVEVLLDLANTEKDKKVRERVLAISDCIIRTCLVKK